MDAWVGVFGGVLVAVVGALLAYFNTQRTNRRHARLDRVNRQLEELYGPMLAQAEASARGFTTFRARLRDGKPYMFTEQDPLTVRERDIWEVWMRQVFMPANRTVYDLIVTKTHLIDDDVMPEPLIHFLAHVKGYEVTMAAWDIGDYTHLTSTVDHPGREYDEYLRESFARLKKRQQKLLGGSRP